MPSAEKARAQAAEGGTAQQVEVTGRSQLSDTEQRRREPVAKTVYGRDELDKYGDTAVSDVLKRLPGINLQGGSPRLRGLGAGYTLVLINGEPAPPGFSLDNLSPAQVERIEVTKGPTAEHSAQAVGGTINIILREPPRQRQRELRVGLAYVATRPTGSFNGTYGDRFGALSVVLPLSLYQWRGAARSEGERYAADVQQAQLHARTANQEANWGGGFNLGPRLSWKLSDTDSLNLQSFVQRGDFRNAGQTVTEVLQGTPPISVNDRYLNRGFWQMGRVNLQLVRRWADGARLEARAGVQASASHYDTQTVGLDAAGIPTLDRHASGDNRERGASSSGKWTRPWREDHTFALGWDIEQRRRRELRTVIENGQSQLIGFDGEPFEARIERQALYAQDEWNIAPRWSTYLGLRGERLRTTSGGSSDASRSSSQVLTPVLHLNHKLDDKGRDLVRASLTRSYRAPETGALLARPSINASYPLDTTNPEIAPDRIGNPALKPELATGLDIAFEKYFSAGGLISIGAFHRRIDGLIRQQVTLEQVAWASAPRWVSRPVNLRRASSSGLEIELKGRAGELLPDWFDPALALDVRASASLYRSRVDDIPGPDNRLEGQQPWSMTLGFDHKPKAWPLTYGASFAYTPSYRTQQTVAQLQAQGVTRTLDAYLLWAFDRQTTLRLAANNLRPLDTIGRTTLPDDGVIRQDSQTRRHGRTSFQASWTLKF
ncbi:TonB-dependent receptor plug domain-containing protein [Aquabacterium sp.]|uniref:TonB-dependent receptor plug domain-containing protein n=1 Tax=Aquabacterium sp. TaxID=1872578 RepID=UPI0037833AEA